MGLVAVLQVISISPLFAENDNLQDSNQCLEAVKGG